jgi:predicted nucleic acid-binding protein
MAVYVLDSSAVLRYVDDEAGADRVEAILRACVAWQAKACLSAVQWGEIAGRLRARLGAADQMRVLSALLPSEVTIVPATGEHAVRAAALKVDRKIAYADGFALDLAMSSPDCTLVTADYGFKELVDLAQIEFLPAK